jgi:hypothetical protein
LARSAWAWVCSSRHIWFGSSSPPSSRPGSPHGSGIRPSDDPQGRPVLLQGPSAVTSVQVRALQSSCDRVWPDCAAVAPADRLPGARRVPARLPAMAVDGTSTAPTARCPYRDAEGQPAAGRPFPVMVICRWSAYLGGGHGAGLKPGSSPPAGCQGLVMPTAMEANRFTLMLTVKPRESPRRCTWAVGPQATGTVPALSYQAVSLQGPPYERGERRCRALAQVLDSRSTREWRQHIHA